MHVFDGLLFNGAALTCACFVDRVCWALLLEGIDYSPYSGHSFQIGAATSGC